MKLTEDIIKNEDTAMVKESQPSESLLSIKSPVVGEKVNDRKPTVTMSKLSTLSSSSDSMSSVEDVKQQFDRFKTGSLAFRTPLGSGHESTVNGISEQNVKETSVALDFDSLVSNYNDRNDGQNRFTAE